MTYSFDILLRGQEIVTACQLLHSYQDVRTAFQSREHPIDPDSPGWQPYTTAHEIGMPPWGGFGRKSDLPRIARRFSLRSNILCSGIESSCPGVLGTRRYPRNRAFPAGRVSPGTLRSIQLHMHGRFPQYRQGKIRRLEFT